MANIKVTQIDFSSIADAKVLDILGKNGKAISKNLDQIVKAKGTIPWLYPCKGKDDGVVRDKKSLRVYSGVRGEAKKPVYKFVENEITTEEILEYEQKIKSGEVAFVLKNITTEQLSNNYKHPLQIDGQEWPSVEHYVLAHQFTDSSLREQDKPLLKYAR